MNLFLSANTKGEAPMFRFLMPDATLPVREQILQLREQCNAFLLSVPLCEIFRLLRVDALSLRELYNGRKQPDGRILESQELSRQDDLEAFRSELYPLLRELGFLNINRPLKNYYTRILVLGGSLNACFTRTVCAKEHLQPSVQTVDALACYRPLNPIERSTSVFSTAADTEFGAVSDAFAKVFGLDAAAAQDDFTGDRNLNGISCVRTFPAPSEPAFRVFAAPSTRKDLRRADTDDSLLFYLDRTCPEASDSFLMITDNRYCNRQLLQIACRMLRLGRSANLELIGCTPDERIVTPEEYDPYQFLQDLISVLDWIDRINTEL